jgi:ABC-2 type transport system permease protein
MNAFRAAFWGEMRKALRSKIPWATFAGMSLLPAVDGLFMVILKDPERARALGLISLKAQLAAGVADWPTFCQMLVLGTAIGAGMVFAIITAWVFGREFSDHTAKELLALPTPRATIVAAKFVLTAAWVLTLVLWTFALAMFIGGRVDIPGWSPALPQSTLVSLLTAAGLTVLLMPYIAWLAGVGRGYLLPLGWAFLSIVLSQIAVVLGWGDWFPWSVPALVGGPVGGTGGGLEAHSYLVVGVASIVGLGGTVAWWLTADQTR